MRPLDRGLRCVLCLDSNQKKDFMGDSQECVESIIIDVCRKSFLLFSDEGNSKRVDCETSKQFMNVLEVVTANLNPEQIKYSELAVYENSHS